MSELNFQFYREDNKHVATFGGESNFDDFEMDNYGIQIGGVSISGLPAKTMIELVTTMADHLYLNGHRFKIVETGEQDLAHRLVLDDEIEKLDKQQNLTHNMDMIKKVLVTGVTGQDGSYMADYLLANTDYAIYGMIRRTSKPDLSNLKNALLNPRFKVVIGDLSDSVSIDNLVNEIKPDYFVNLAAQSFVASSWHIPEQTFDIDAAGVIRCLEAIRKHSPRCRFYNAGSSEEFGDVVFSPQTLAHPSRARSPYGAAKIASRQITKVYRESFNMYAIQGLLFNHESERRGEEFVTRKITLGIGRIVNALKNHNYDFAPIELGNLDAKRDWSHAEDFVEGIWLMLNQDSPKEFLLSSNETHSIREFIELAFKAAGLNGVWCNFSGKPEDEEYLLSDNGFLATKRKVTLVKVNPQFYRPAEVSLLHGDSTDARLELGWKPKNTFQRLVERMVKNDIENYKN